jgi:hypothetical protein
MEGISHKKRGKPTRASRLRSSPVHSLIRMRSQEKPSSPTGQCKPPNAHPSTYPPRVTPLASFSQPFDRIYKINQADQEHQILLDNKNSKPSHLKTKTLLVTQVFLPQVISCV